MQRLGWTVAAVAVLTWSARGAEIDFPELIASSGNMVEFLRGFIKPDFADWRDFGSEMLVTIQIAVWGTFLALVLAVPCSLLCAENISPWWIRHPMRRLMDAFRAINEMIFAMLFITAVGLGPFAGVLALFVHTLGTLTKLFSEAVEAIDPRPVEGVRATGASPIDEIVYGVIPQVMPLWVSYTLYRFEANVRSASVVGMVGAGGIGMLLWDAIRGFDYARTSAMLLIIVLTVTLLDYASGIVRKQLT
ncbi:MAG: phosphonate ABC transporter, permease protein PhnE [Planctomycetota bacterium]